MKYISIFIAICISIFTSLINIGIGLFFGWVASTYICHPLFFIILFITLVYTLYDAVIVYGETNDKIYGYLNNEKV